MTDTTLPALPIVHYVREQCRDGDDVPHDDLVEHLADRGAAQKQIDFHNHRLVPACGGFRPTATRSSDAIASAD